MEKINKAFIGEDGYSFPNSKKRVGWIDITKGIAILFVVYSHSVNWENKLEAIPGALIFSFHMPLFFILSAITTKYSNNMHEFYKNSLKTVKHLFIPIIIIFLFIVLHGIYTNPNNFLSFHFWKEKILVFIFHRAIYANFNGIVISALGPGWFLIVLLLSKILFDYMQMQLPKKILLLSVCILSLIGVCLAQFEFLPMAFSFDIVLAVMFFLYIGYRFKDLKKIKWTKLQYIVGYILLFLVWLIPALLSYQTFFDMGSRRYPLFPLCFLTAIAGSFLLIRFTKQLEKAKIFLPFQFLGRYCIYFYVVHCLDFAWVKWYTFVHNNFLNFLTRVAIDLAFFLVVVVIHISITKIIKAKKLKKKLQ